MYCHICHYTKDCICKICSHLQKSTNTFNCKCKLIRIPTGTQHKFLEKTQFGLECDGYEEDWVAMICHK